MQNSRTRNSLLTMVLSGIRQSLTLLLTFASRTVFIYVLGAEYLGLNGLFSNILSILALSELGIGAAISFYLYKPLADQDKERIKSLMMFYKVCYRIVGMAIIVLGCSIMPFLPLLVNFDQKVPVNLYIVYFLYLLNTASSYLFFAYKQALIIANQEQYKIEKVNIWFTFINCFADILVLVIVRDYISYLLVKTILVLIKNLVIARKIDGEYPFIKESNVVPLQKREVASFFKDIGAVALFRVGSTLYNATDNIIISILLGTTVVGYYSNYFLIISQVAVVVGLVIKSFTAGIGNVIASESKEKQFEVFKQLDFIVYAIALFCTACLFQLLNSFIRLWVGGVSGEYVLSQAVVFCLCVSFYFDNTTQIMNSFREASGNFGTGKSLQIVGGICNIVLSVILGRAFGLVGIFAATILCKGFITMIPFMAGVSRNVFGKSRGTLIVRYGSNMSVMLLTLGILWTVGRHFHMGGILYFMIECSLSAAIPVIILYVVYWNRPETKALQSRILHIAHGFMKRRTR